MNHVHRRGARPGIVAALVGKLGVAALTLGACAALMPAVAVADEPTLSVDVGSNHLGQPLPPGFLSVSFEYKAMHLYTGRDPDALNAVLVALLKALAPGQPTILRVGGDSTDQTWWPMRRVIPPAGITYALTKGWLRTTKAFAQALGARLILGINLAAGRPPIAAAEARSLLQGIGRSNIAALEIGNEPDLYHVFAWYRDRRGRLVFARPSRYGLTSLIGDFSRWRAAIPQAPLAGPTLSSLNWMGGLDRFMSSQSRLGVVTFHRYPLRACLKDTTSPSYASIPNLLSDASSATLAAQVAPYTQIAHAHGLPFRLDELNSASCAGKRGVSDTFASALWVLDTLFNMASVGVDGVNFHTLPGSAYEPFTFTHPRSGWRAFVRPIYYGAFAFAQAFPPGAQLLGVSAPAGPLKVWATQAPDGRIRVVLINKAPDAPVRVQLHLPGASTGASLEALQAASLNATSGVSFAGQTFGPETSTGRLPAPQGTPTAATFRTYNVEVRAGSALLLTR